MGKSMNSRGVLQGTSTPLALASLDQWFSKLVRHNSIGNVCRWQRHQD